MGGFGRKAYEFLSELGLDPRNPGCFVNGAWRGSGPVVGSRNPTNNQASTFSPSMRKGVPFSRLIFFVHVIWGIPAPQRGEIVRQIDEALRTKLYYLGRLVSLEMGKILPEGIGEVQVCSALVQLIEVRPSFLECLFRYFEGEWRYLKLQLNSSGMDDYRSNNYMLCGTASEPHGCDWEVLRRRTIKKTLGFK
ncbi:hypothetical protein ZIOFF_007482 [Zingiber officinale]|uniref:Uncharacterized protein n=1 Tax=Zingiber officinale TaxID=94328 RepID=A0A8J5LWI2_ZINOF|nr:hypothetical protein ZIOFF_007482 [Zingiber officinale]